MSVNASNLVSAESMVTFSSDNISQMMGLTANDSMKASNTVNSNTANSDITACFGLIG